MINGYKLTLKPSKKDERNYKFIPHEYEKKITLPESFILKNIDDLKIYDQGQIGSCSANAIAQVIQIKTNNKLSISRLYQYMNSRILEGTTFEDSGCSLLDACKALMKYRYIDEALYPYIVEDFAKFPPKDVYIKASRNPFKEYRSVQQDLYHIKYALAINKQPIVCGIMIFDSFQNLDENFVCPTPDPIKDIFLEYGPDNIMKII